MKKCGRCRLDKDNSQYYNRGGKRSGLMSWCRSCASEASKVHNKNIKLEAFDHYGGCECVCCGVAEEVFLALDHVNNDGASHRKEIGSGAQFYKWLRRNNWPRLDLQVLCHNCNWAKQFGVCPHRVRQTNSPRMWITPEHRDIARYCRIKTDKGWRYKNIVDVGIVGPVFENHQGQWIKVSGK